MSNIKKRNVAEYSEGAYLSYSMHVVGNRSIPSLRDGQKPVQRRILFAMRELNLSHEKDAKKCARIIGDIIGQYHPHGDTAAYEALVKMSQDFYLRYPLVNGQGNFGTIDGDKAAAMRYTEAKLTAISDLLLNELGMNSCDFLKTYDNSTTEPEILPSRLNFMLMNGSFGLAVGLATDMPSHNIRNVTDATIHYIKNPDCSTRDLVEHIKAPDYPTGGKIINSLDEIVDAYDKGQGSFTVRCKWFVEKLEKGSFQIVIDELPPRTSPEKILARIGLIERPKQSKDVASGKPHKLTKQQSQEKAFLLNTISEVRDDSNKDGIRIVIKPKRMRDDPESVMNSLYKLLDLEKNIPLNLVTIGLDGFAKNKNLKDIISEWSEFRLETIRKRTLFSYAQANKKIHLLEAKQVAHDNIDEILEVIKNSDSPKVDLMDKFNLSDIQSEYILEIKLRQLANIELDKILRDLELLRKEADRLESLLESKTKMKNLMIKEIESDTLKYEDERRTVVEESKRSVFSQKEIIMDEKVTVVYTKQGWITKRKGHDVDISTISLKDDDSIFKVLESRSVDKIVFLVNNGRLFNINPDEIPSGKNMVHINSLIDVIGSYVVDALVLDSDKRYLVSNDSGYGFITSGINFNTKNKAGKSFMSLGVDNNMFRLRVVDKKYISCLSSDNRLLTYPLTEIKDLPKGKGVQLIKLSSELTLESFWLHSSLDVLINDKKEFNLDTEGAFNKRALRGKNIKFDINNISDKA